MKTTSAKTTANHLRQPSASHAALLDFLLPLLVCGLVVAVWAVFSALRLFPESAFPPPGAVGVALIEELRGGRLFTDIVASLWRVGVGFGLSVLIGVPTGLWLGLRFRARQALLPLVNFLRYLSPIAWVPFAVLWFGIGDTPAIFLIVMAALFPLSLATLAAVSAIPSIRFRVAEDFHLTRIETLREVIIPAILPELITALRVTAGLAWLVLVAAEMIAGRDGLGYLIWDARNGLRMDLLVVGMIVIGLIGILIDRALARLTRLPGVRWGYER